MATAYPIPSTRHLRAATGSPTRFPATGYDAVPGDRVHGPHVVPLRTTPATRSDRKRLSAVSPGTAGLRVNSTHDTSRPLERCNDDSADRRLPAVPVARRAG